MQWIVWPSGGARSIVITVSVCLSVCLHISKTRCPNFTNFSVHVTCECGSDIAWWPCNILCTYIFVDDVMFLDNGVYLAYGEAYGRGMSISRRHRREGQSFGASALCLSVGCHWLTSLSGRPRHTQRSLAVEANNALCTRMKSAVLDFLVMAALCNRGGHYIFALYFLSFFLSFFFLSFFFPRLISAVGDWMFTILWHMAWP